MLFRRYAFNKPEPAQPIFTITNTINTNIQNVFTIYNFNTNTPIEIISKTQQINYLSASATGSEIMFEQEEDGSGRQKWVIERDPRDPAIYYIKTEYYHKHGVKYIGCPNKSGFAYFYT